MKKNNISRRKFIATSTVAAIGSSFLGFKNICSETIHARFQKDIVSIVRVKNGDVVKAVEEAVDLLGGIKSVTEGKTSILLKPNLVAPDRRCTTKVEVIKALAQMLKREGKEVMVGEGCCCR